MRWGRLSMTVKTDLMAACAQLLKCESLVDVLRLILPSESLVSIMDCTGELVLWADRHGRRRDTGVIAHEGWPQLGGECPLLREWQASRANWCRPWPREQARRCHRTRNR